MSIEDAIEAVCDKEPLFASMVKKLHPVKDNEHCPTLGTDGQNLYYNTEYTKTLNDEELCAVVLHEVLHCAFMHQWRREERDPWKWNIATDYAINTVVNESFALPKGALLDTKYYGMSADDIYDSLSDDKSQPHQEWCEKDSWEGEGQEGQGQGKGEEEGDNPFEAAWKKLTGQGKKKKTKTAKQLEAEWKRAFDKTFIKEYGHLPDSIQRVIQKDYYVPVIDWASLVASLLSEDVNDYTFATPDRRFLEADYILPAQYSIDKLQDVVFAYDTSGSISEDDLKAFYYETLSLFQNFSNLQGWIAICDAYLHSFTELNPKQSFNEFNFMGGGGTDFAPVFNEISRRQMKPKAMFYFTDTYGSFPSEKPEYPVFWMVRSYIGDNQQYDMPFGRVIKFLAK